MRVSRQARAVAIVALSSALLLTGVYAATLYGEISALIEQRHAALSSSIYSAPHSIRVGDDLERSRLLERLTALSYSRVATVAAPGQYRESASELAIYLRGFRIGGHHYPPSLIDVRLAGGKITAVADRSDSAFPPRLEPETIGRLIPGAAAERVEIRLADQPSYLIQGLLAVEDQLFYYHPGINPVRIAEAAVANLRQRRFAQGASTLTQQLARTFLQRYERSIGRKLHELAVALVLEIRLTKDEILERYINDVSLGAYAGAPIHGMPQAARSLFNKDLRQVTPAEAATLIGMVRAPTLYDPRRHPEASRRRRDLILAQMKRHGVIDEAAWIAAVGSDLELAPRRDLQPAPHFTDFVIASLRAAGVTGDLAGLEVFTTLDTAIQSRAAAAVTDNLDRLEKGYPGLRRRGKDGKLQSAAVVVDARSGAIRAMIGSRDYSESQFNRATSGLRQPGSVFKPFVYLAALDPDRSPISPPLTLASLLPDEPLSFEGWMPANHDRRFAGPVTAVRALSESLNVPAAYLGIRLGPELMVRTAHELGIPQELEAVPSIAIGTEETTLLDLTSAYQVFANGGTRSAAWAIEAVVDADDREIYRHRGVSSGVVRADVAYLVTAALRSALGSGTGATAARLGFDLPAAGKTGTTQDYRDAYFVGYTPDLVAGVWVGFDAPRSLGLTGAQAALPPWVRIMKASASRRDFEVPPGVVFATIDSESGELASSACPSRLRVPFLAGTAPTGICRLHGADTLTAAADQNWGGWRSTMPAEPAPEARRSVFRQIGRFFESLFRH